MLKAKWAENKRKPQQAGGCHVSQRTKTMSTGTRSCEKLWSRLLLKAIVSTKPRRKWCTFQQWKWCRSRHAVMTRFVRETKPRPLSCPLCSIRALARYQTKMFYHSLPESITGDYQNASSNSSMITEVITNKAQTFVFTLIIGTMPFSHLAQVMRRYLQSHCHFFKRSWIYGTPQRMMCHRVMASGLFGRLLFDKQGCVTSSSTQIVVKGGSLILVTNTA